MNKGRFVFLLYFCFYAYAQDSENIGKKFFDPEYKLRRSKLIQLMDSNSAAILRTAEPKLRSNDVYYPFKQECNFFYLSGIDEPDYFLVISSKKVEFNNRNFFSLLFAPMRGKDTMYISGEEVVLNKSKFYEVFGDLLKNSKTIYISAPEYKTINDWLNNKIYISEKVAKNTLREKFPELQVKNITTLTSPLREIKSEKEIAYIQEAINITGDGLIRAIQKCRPDMYEYEIQAEIEYEFKRQGATGTGFPSIIASGENSLILHYDRNNRRMQRGDVLLMDVGAEYNWYSADITRTIPVSGKFTEAQKRIYSVVLKAQKETINIIKPGVTMSELNKKASSIIEEAGYGNFIKHSVSHCIGLDVHDTWSSDTLKAGMIITIEPGIYIPKDAEDLPPEYRGFGIRIEDDVLVTEDGHKVLSEKIPKEISEIENLMRKN